jgi:cytoskeletal protein CcmA (bactofilin family)
MADIEGKFEGKIKVEDTLNIKETAHIIGEVIIGKLSVEPGATFNATCVMLSSNSKATTSADE